jgi:glyoxylase-like metal-dependent hydrolase (beta-lactamase superfamily II)
MDPFADAGLPNPGVTCIPLPTPFPVGRVNAYLLDGDAPILVDTGLNSDRAYDELAAALGRVGRRVVDVRTILLTHTHLDHAGLAARLREESGARLACLRGAAPSLEHFDREWDLNQAYIREAFPGLGLPVEVVEMIVTASRPFARFGRATAVDMLVDEGGAFSSGPITVRALHTAGHTPWCTTWIDAAGRFALSGDFLLKKITANPVLQRPDETTGIKTRPLEQFLASLRRFASLDVPLVLPGHGEAIDNPREVVRRVLRHHRRRLTRVRMAISDSPRTPFEVVGAIFRHLPAAESFLAISEVMAHLEILEAEGTAIRLDGNPIRFRCP